MIRRFLKSLAGRKGGATHNGTPGSHVNTKRNKRIANKALRFKQEVQFHEIEDLLDLHDPEDYH